MESTVISIFEHQAFTKIANGIYTTVYHLSHTYDMKLELEKLDIEPSLKVMEAFIRDIYLRNNNEKNIKTAIKHLIDNFNYDILDEISTDNEKVLEYLFILKQYIENNKEQPNQKISLNTIETIEENTIEENTIEEDTIETIEEDTIETIEENTIEEEILKTIEENTIEEETIEGHLKLKNENSLTIALFNVKESVNKLYTELSALRESMEYHNKEKYFSSWRTNTDILIFLEKLKIYKNIFNERSSLLMNIATFYV